MSDRFGVVPGVELGGAVPDVEDGGGEGEEAGDPAEEDDHGSFRRAAQMVAKTKTVETFPVQWGRTSRAWWK